MVSLETIYFSIVLSGDIISLESVRLCCLSRRDATTPAALAAVPRWSQLKKGKIVMSDLHSDPFGARASLDVGGKTYTIYRLDRLAAQAGADLAKLPFSVKVVLEALLRNVGDGFTEAEDVKALANWTPASA